MKFYFVTYETSSDVTDPPVACELGLVKLSACFTLIISIGMFKEYAQVCKAIFLIIKLKKKENNF